MRRRAAAFAHPRTSLSLPPTFTGLVCTNFELIKIKFTKVIYFFSRESILCVSDKWQNINRISNIVKINYHPLTSSHIYIKYTKRPMYPYPLYLTIPTYPSNSFTPSLITPARCIPRCTVLPPALWLYSPCWPWPLFQFPNLCTVGRTPWTSDQAVARPLPIHRTTQTV
jgi:hypothetical protein